MRIQIKVILYKIFSFIGKVRNIQKHREYQKYINIIFGKKIEKNENFDKVKNSIIALTEKTKIVK